MIVLMDERMDEGGSEEFVKSLRQEFQDVEFRTGRTNEDLEKEVPFANVYYGMPWQPLVEQGQLLRWVHFPATGIDGLTFGDIDLVDRNIVVTNCRGPHASSMADHAIGVMVMLAHQLHEMWGDQKNSHWDRSKYIGRQVEISGKLMGLVGVGDIGMSIARRAHGFDMEIYAVDKNTEPRKPYIQEVWDPERIDDLMQISDWLVVAAPLTKETIGLIDRRRINLLKEDSCVIVMSRGKIVDENALADALREGHLAGAAIDAFAEEPVPPGSPLWDVNNLIITPHMSGATPELTEGRREIFRENLRRFISGEPFLYVPDLRAGY